MNFDSPAAPESVGMRPDMLDALRTAVDVQLSDRLALGVQVVVARHGQVVLDIAKGIARRDGNVPVTPEALFYSWSVAKPITAMAVHLLIERGRVTLDTPLASVWPEFGQNGKEAVTVGHVLSHRGGFPRTPESLPWHQYGNWGAATDAVAAMPLDFAPGSAVQYHPLTFGWALGEVVRRVDGRPIERFAREEFFTPLDMRYAYLKLTEDQLSQTVELVAHNDFPDGMQAAAGWNQPVLRLGVIPAAGLHANARAVARFYQMLLNGGELDGVRVLSPQSIARAQMPSGLPGETELDTGWPTHRAFGFSLGGNTHTLWGGERSSTRAFGHNGWATNIAFADPDRDLVCIILNNLMLNDETNYERLTPLCTLALEACD